MGEALAARGESEVGRTDLGEFVSRHRERLQR
jgi:hypothetical protein